MRHTLKTESKMEEKIILTKESGKEDVKKYFTSVLELSKTSEEFPVNLDEVWMLVYGRKDYAVDALKKDFIEGIDFTSTSAKTEVGSLRYDYHLSVPCLEFFIARKVRSVFDVYRQVFHKVVQGFQSTTTSVKEEAEIGLLFVREAKSLLNLSDDSVAAMYNKVASKFNQPLIDYVPSKGVSKPASELLKDFNVGISAQAFNKLLASNGIIVKMFHNSTGGRKKPFWNIPNEYLSYGENFKPIQSHGSTQPYWYVDKFKGLLRLVGLE